MSTIARDDYSDLTISVVISLLAWPVTYFVDQGIMKVEEDKRTLYLMGIGFVLLTVTTIALRIWSKQKSWMKYVFIAFAFTGVIDLIIGLELKGWISGFMSQYLAIGEPYLSSPWGCAIVIFDGTFFFAMYLLFVHRISNNQSWRSVGIYWVSAIVNSMIVLLLGVATGRHSPTFCTFLNVPYAVVPIIVGIRLFSKEKDENWSVNRLRSNGVLSDVAVSIGLVYSMWVAFAKGVLSIGSQFAIFQDVLSHERALLDVNPAPFAIIQSFVFLLYAMPIFIVSLFYIFSQRKPQFLWDLALINGGLLLQAQFSFILTALDSQTSAQLRSDPLDWIFWMNNLVLLLAPQAFLWSLYRSNVQNVSDGKQIKKNKNK